MSVAEPVAELRSALSVTTLPPSAYSSTCCPALHSTFPPPKAPTLASVRESLLSALYGNAVARGDIDLKQSLAELGIDDNEPSLSVEEKTATVRDLLEARSGVYHAALYEPPSMAVRRPPRHSHPPGTFWY